MPSTIPAPLTELVNKKRRRILLVDDDPDVVRVLGLLLEAKGQEVRVVWEPATALDAAIEFSPHIAILDIEMPGMSGLELARRLQETPGLEKMGLIALSGWNDQSTRDRCRDVGFHRFFAKPAPMDQILFALSEYD